MARDGSGTYDLPNAPFVANSTIESTVVNGNFSDMASALSQSLSKDGQTVPTGNLPMGGFRHTGVGIAQSRTHYLRADQYIDGGLVYAEDGGTADAYAVTLTPGITVYIEGSSFFTKIANANATTTPTFAVNALTAGTITWPDGSALAAGDLPEGACVEFFCAAVSTGTPTWHLMTPTRAAAWNASAAVSPWTTGDVKLTLKTTADTGWILCNDGTIGDASSSATTRANADTSALYTLLWTNVSDTYAPVTGGRGVSASADFAAHKPIAITKMLGRALGIAGAGSGLTSRALGFTVGEETHQLTVTEMPAHTHAYSVINTSQQSGASGSFLAGPAASSNTGSTGGDGAHNTMQPTSFLNAMIKL